MKILVALFILLFFVTTSASAINYECITSQATEFNRHILEPTEDSTVINSIVRFNNENGDMWIALNGAPFSPFPLKIVHKENGYQDMTAVFDGPNNALSIGSTFLTWEGKDRTVTFLFFISSAKRLLTGTCHRYNKELMKIDREQLDLKTF